VVEVVKDEWRLRVRITLPEIGGSKNAIKDRAWLVAKAWQHAISDRAGTTDDHQLAQAEQRRLSVAGLGYGTIAAEVNRRVAERALVTAMVSSSGPAPFGDGAFHLLIPWFASEDDAADTAAEVMCSVREWYRSTSSLLRRSMTVDDEYGAEWSAELVRRFEVEIRKMWRRRPLDKPAVRKRLKAFKKRGPRTEALAKRRTWFYGDDDQGPSLELSAGDELFGDE
jgi:hypothetical protein